MIVERRLGSTPGRVKSEANLTRQNHEPLQYESLAHVVTGFKSEFGVLIVALLAAEGSHTIPSLRESLAYHGEIDASVKSLPYAYQFHREVERLVSAGLVKTDELYSKRTLKLTPIGEGMGVIAAGYQGEFSLSHPDYHLHDLWATPRRIKSKPEVVITTQDGEIQYARRATEDRLRVMDAIAQASTDGVLSLGLSQLLSKINAADGDMSKTMAFDILHDLARKGIITYGPLSDELTDSAVYKTKPNESAPPASAYPYRPEVFTKIVERYIASQETGVLLAPSQAVVYSREHDPDFSRRYEHRIKDDFGRVMRHLAKEGQLDPMVQPSIHLTSPQTAIISEVITMMKNIQERNPDGIRKVKSLVGDADKVAQLFAKGTT